MTTVERIAREIEPLAWAALGMCDTLKHARRRETSLVKAVAAIQAMREPHEAILVAMGDYNSHRSRERWQAGIDAILAEHAAGQEGGR